METGRTKDGRFVIKRTEDTTWTEVPEDVYRAAKAGPAEAFGRSAVEGTRDLGAGGTELLAGGLQVGESGPNFDLLNLMPGGALVRQGLNAMQGVSGVDATELAREIRTENDPRQEALREGQPVASFAGEMLPELALGAPARTIRGAMALDAALGAARNPDDPLTGAAIGAGIGGAANVVTKGVTRATQRGLNIGQNVVNTVRGRPRADSVNAARNPDPEFTRTERELRGFIEPSRAEQLGFRLTPGERMALEATSAEQLAIANRIRDTEDLVASTNITGTGIRGSDIPGISRFARDDHRQAFTSYIGDILDEPNVDTLTPRRLGDLLADTQAVFKENIDELDEPIPSATIIDDVSEMAEEIGPTGQSQLAKLAKDIQKLGEDGNLDAQATTSLMNILQRRSKAAFDAGNYELGSAYSAVRNSLNDAIVAVAEEVRPGAAVELKLARQKYGIIKSLQRGRAVDPGGIINAQTFSNNYAKTHRRYANGQDDSELAQVMDTMNYLTARQTGDSGTAARLIAAGVGSAPATAAGAGAAAAGYNALFGR